MFKALIERLMLITFTPAKAWLEIIKENPKETDVRNNYVFPFMGLIAFASFLGAMIFGEEDTFNLNVQHAVIKSCVTFVSLFAGFFLASFVLNEIVEKFKLEKNLQHSQIFVGYASSILYAIDLVLELQLIPEFFFLQIFIFYTVYVIWESVGIYYSVVEERRVLFVAVTSLIVLAAPSLIEVALKYLLPGVS
ncbi:MAG: YIP1 family protein [Bacteroidales bacterium]|nr:YIP1 family protein [Bacteroidales bacterium]